MWDSLIKLMLGPVLMRSWVEMRYFVFFTGVDRTYAGGCFYTGSGLGAGGVAATLTTISTLLEMTEAEGLGGASSGN